MTSAQPGTRPGYIPAIDGLRAVAVSAVILFHLWPAVLPGGFTGVDIFFVISGFVVTRSMLGREFAGLKALLGYFYARRLMRIMPALIVMLLVTAIAANLFIPNAWMNEVIPHSGTLAFAGLSNIVFAVAGAGYFTPLPASNPFTHSWSLGVEEQFYLIFPFLLFHHQRLRRQAVLLVAILTGVSLVLAAAMTWKAPPLAYFLIFSRFWELGAGMLLCLTLDR